MAEGARRTLNCENTSEYEIKSRAGESWFIRRIWAFGIPLALEESFGDRERGKAELGSNTKFAQAQEILSNVIRELAPTRTTMSALHLPGAERCRAYMTNALSSSSSSSFAKSVSSSIASLFVNSWYTLVIFFSSSLKRFPCRSTSSVIYFSKPCIRDTPLSNRECKIISYGQSEYIPLGGLEKPACKHTSEVIILEYLSR